jgi:phosphatidylinositol glycan class F
VLSLLVAPGLHALLVLFGAPLLALAPHTALLAAHASLLAVFPLLYSRGVDGRQWRAVAAFAAPMDEVFGGLVGAAAGAWLGAIPIPLDWDRDWQRWPVTVLVGMSVGYVVGKAVGGTLGFGRRLAVLAEDDKSKAQ